MVLRFPPTGVMDGVLHHPHSETHMSTPLLPARTGDPDPWDEVLMAFLAEKLRRSGSRRTVEGYSRMLFPFFRKLGGTPDQVTSPDVLAWAHGIGLSGRVPSSTTVGAR